MSNQNVGSVYAQIITDVIDSSRIDFEEGGVEEAVLEELKKGWQKKLTQLNVAQFPWDPKPDPPPQAAQAQAAGLPGAQNGTGGQNPQTGNNGASKNGQASAFPPNMSPYAQNGPPIKQEPVRNEPMIKQEPGTVNNGMPAQHPGFAPSQARGGIAVAQARAAQALESQYGQRAAASISAIHSGMAQATPANPGQAQMQAQLQLQGQRSGQQQQQQQQPQGISAQQYRQGLAASMAAQQQRAQQPAHANGQNGVNNSQMDGTADSYEGVLMQRDADGNPVEMGRMEIDRLLHDQIAANAKQMEGGGLMLPLKEATKHRTKDRKTKSAAGPSQVDGFDDDIKAEEVDEDAINSDLDDTDEGEEDDDDDDDSMGHIMLCMYDKVQRVKNKWKCTLKDGVLTVNGKEYVFHKATGEYEW